VLRSALGTRLSRALRLGRENRRWTDALALFSVVAQVIVAAFALLGREA